MFDDFEPYLNVIQCENGFNTNQPLWEVAITSETTTHPSETPSIAKPQASHLRLVLSKNPEKDPKTPTATSGLIASSAISAPIHISTPAKNSYFTAEVRKRSPYDFVMVAHDPFHYLHCELPLEFENIEGVPALVCLFPAICDEELIDFINGDEDLLGMTLIAFQMQILKNLFVFCKAHKIQNLIIKATEEQFAGLGIYEEFIKYVDKKPTKQGMAVEITIPVPSDSLIACDGFIDDMMAQFRKTLWKGQSANSDIRDYLKANVRLSVIV
jgi:hypothetical protein